MKSKYYFFLFILFSVCFYSAPGRSFDYHVGADQNYARISDVPWEALQAGDSVYIHWQSSSYHEKWVIGRSGTAQAPILVSGVPGPEGQLPVIDGRNATTRQALNYWNERRGLIKIGGSSIPNDPLPSHIIIENLELRSARPPYTFTNDSGGQEIYASNAASFYVEIGQHVTIRHCLIHDSGNGIFIGANGGQTQDMVIEANYIYDNGIEGSIYEHNTYTAAIGIIYQYNFMAGLRSGALGNNLKDRSAGLVIRHNWIEDGNRQLDLVDAEDSDALVNNPSYRSTHVYGNILKESEGEGNSQMVHYGGDSGNEAIYRKGTLYFYNNTLISTRSSNTTLFRLSTNEESGDVHNNIFYVTAPGYRLGLVGSQGQLTMRHNWIKTDWRTSHSTFMGTLTDDGSNIEGTAPGFIDFEQHDYHLAPVSSALDGGVGLHPDLLASHPLTYQYHYHRQGEDRFDDGLLDLGAFEKIQGTTGDVNGNGSVDLTDVILALRVVTGFNDTLLLKPGSDIGSDNRVTIAEAIFCLQNISGLLSQ